jgi:hypothetical protein
MRMRRLLLGLLATLAGCQADGRAVPQAIVF